MTQTGDLIIDDSDKSYGIVVDIEVEDRVCKGYKVIWFNSKVNHSIETDESLENYEKHSKGKP